MDAVAVRPRHDAWVLGLIGTAHFLSHYYIYCLPAVFPLVRGDLGMSFAALGVMMACYNFVGGLLQAPVGFLVDRLGPRSMLIAGLGLNAAAIALMGFAGSYWSLVVLATLAGIGNSVFHPADYSILSGSIGPKRLGRAFSLHTFSGFFGGACTFGTMFALASVIGWRVAFVAVGLVGVVVTGVIWARGEVLVGDGESERRAGAPVARAAGGSRVLMSLPIILMFLFYVAYGIASNAFANYAVSAIHQIHGLDVASGSAAMTVAQFSVAGAVLLGGLIVERIGRGALVVSIWLALAAVASVAIALLPLGKVGVFTIFAVYGLAMGAMLPSRDVMVRLLTPAGQSGKVFGFVSVGLSLGYAVMPVIGRIMDQGDFRAVFLVMAVCLVLAIGTVVGAEMTGGSRRATVAA